MKLPAMPNPWLILAAVALLGGAWGHGHSTGTKSADARHNTALLGQIEAGEKLDAARLVLLHQRNELTRQLEEDAYADPIVVDRCLSPDRVRRLNALH